MTTISQERCLEIITALATELVPLSEAQFHVPDLSNSTTWTAILNLDRQEQATFVMVMLDWCRDHQRSQQYPSSYLSEGVQLGASGVLSAMLQLMNRQLPYTEDDILVLMSYLTLDDMAWWGWYNRRDSILRLIKILEHYLRDHPLVPELVTQIELLITYVQKVFTGDRKQLAKLKSLIQSQTLTLPIQAGDVWANLAIQDIHALPPEMQSRWTTLLLQCSTAMGGKPTAKWLKPTQGLVKDLGWDIFRQALMRWFPEVDKPRLQPAESSSHWTPDPNLLNENNADILKGLVWLCAEREDPELARALMKLAIVTYRKLPGIGPRCVRLGNACVWALGQMPGQVGIAQLAILKVKVKFGSAQQGIEKALTAAAERIGLARSEIEELAVPSYGLETVGQRRETLGDFVAELSVTGTNSTELRWLKADGKPQKSVPKAVKDNFPEELKELKQAAKEIQAMLPAQRDRIESLYLQQRTWDFATWEERYLDHPLLGTLARRLIWQFQDGDHCLEGIWLNGQIVNRNDEPLDWISDRTQVQLWHPITASTETINGWRDWLLTHEIQQPFKQAYRELYVLTPAEENTRVYSNRFAAHILKQHQFNALCGQRGWKNQLRLLVDNMYPPPSLPLPQWGLRAEFWVEGIGDNYATDTNDTGTFLYLATDQVRFYPVEANTLYAHAGGGGYGSYFQGTLPEPTPLTEIPALVFTEVMRDVDLFVGVASVGNDPNWVDGGRERPQAQLNYWQDYSFGELSETAKTRRSVLEKLVPRLKIRDRCHFQEKFLVVQGDLRTYKIHLGSGNILMEPNDQYLCIVPNQSQSNPTSQVFLPFEGDNMMAIILSKALLLAEDQKIKDSTILSQIKR